MSRRAIQKLKILAAMLAILGLIVLGSLLNPTESSAKEGSAQRPEAIEPSTN